MVYDRAARPFPNRADILLGARKEVYINAMVANGVAQKTAEIRSWEAFDLQEAVMDLKQGGGRLIRTEDDRGVVALLDLRAHSKPPAPAKAKAYAGRVRGSLPHPYLQDKAMVLNILSALGRQAGPRGV
jgi:Rad3-related DNA helicase